MLSLRAYAIMMAVIFGAIVVLAAIGDALEAAGSLPSSPAVKWTSVGIFLVLCAALTFSAVPVMVKLVLGAQIRAGNAGRPAIAWLIAHERGIVFAYWVLLALGLILAVPAAILDGAFD